MHGLLAVVYGEVAAESRERYVERVGNSRAARVTGV